ncbi:vWA domain-containing protein [Crateriforma conspicua]|uniref:von Willebrand factor type A domain protein n=1 Tax=Crateriforma conspicua TaxID=2527996 RepID=A0A5C5YB32_9PLAN|nr:VWA domain-containing protein [Crateriforma conspicua]QDV61170.1 von Willebrand factor type A domain protein [Crateriforma conspicua]TWT72580.1 von Willebrand factor type A domain protein [Crateriforma conspicua]
MKPATSACRIFTGSWLILGLLFGSNLHAEQVQLDVRLVNPTIKSGAKQTNYLRVALTGFDMPSDKERPPVNVALVLDRSGSMSGEKIARAKEAAITAINRLSDQDIVSVILYDSNVEVLVPATKASDRESIKAAIRSVQANGSTALFAGVSKGAAEVRKFLADDQVNRVILLSDGLANVGPKSPQDLESLGRSLIKEGISVSTLGLGLNYNEDLMVALASVGGGNHAFIEQADDLVAVFNQEFDGLLSVVANEFEINIDLDPSVRPVRLIGSEGDIDGQSVHIPLAQLYAKQERYFILETEIDAGESDTTRPVADVAVKYRNLKTETMDKLTSHVEVRFSDSDTEIEKARDLEILAYCTLQVTTERNRRATALRDAGQVQEAQKLLRQNADELSVVRLQCADAGVDVVLPELSQVEKSNSVQAESIIDVKKWGMLRKGMRAMQNRVEQQQTYGE